MSVFEGANRRETDEQQEQENATELFERATRFSTLEEAEAALQEGIYGSK